MPLVLSANVADAVPAEDWPPERIKKLRRAMAPPGKRAMPQGEFGRLIYDLPEDQAQVQVSNLEADRDKPHATRPGAAARRMLERLEQEAATQEREHQ